MSDTATRLIKKLLASQTLTNIVGRRVFQSRVPEGQGKPYVWLNRRGLEDDGLLSGSVGDDSAEEYFDAECWAAELDDSQATAAAIRGAIHNYYGTFDDAQVAAIVVSDHDDNYTPQGGDLEVKFCAALNIQISYR